MLGERFYRFNKYCLYESSVRIPMILSGSALPAVWRGKTDHRSAELVDLYPTILKAAGLKVPPTSVGLDLLGDRKRPASFCALHERKSEAAFMWRTRRYKLVLRMERKADASQYTALDTIGGEFYDLQTDPQEWNNLYDDPKARPDVRKRMTEELLTHLRGLGSEIDDTRRDVASAETAA
jgi:arylsulfatase A-like enzyme